MGLAVSFGMRLGLGIVFLAETGVVLDQERRSEGDSGMPV